jgi:fumarate hydratase class II
MNVNEVLANRASELLGGERGTKRLVHPNDDVNLGQSSNDVFRPRCTSPPRWRSRTSSPQWTGFGRTLHEKSAAFEAIVKIGRTHLQDATPLTLGAGVLGVRRAAGACRLARSKRAAGACTSSPSAGPRSGTASIPIRTSRPGCALILAASSS